MRSMLMPGALLAGLGLLSACSSSAEPPPEPVTLELATWWTNTADNRALQALLDVQKSNHPDVTINLVPLASPQILQTAVTKRFSEGNPPATFQATLGTGALRWGDQAESLNANAPWLNDFNSLVIEQLTFNGTLIGVPLGYTRQNAAYWNVKILKSLAAAMPPKITKAIPETTAEFETWLAELTALGYTHPICFGGKDASVSAQVLFDHIVPAIAGKEFSREYWSGKRDPNDQLMVDALTVAKEVASVLSPNFIDMDTNAGLNKLMAAESDIANQCLVAPAGDWGWPFLAVSYIPNDMFIGTGWPGKTNNKLVVFAGDTFIAAKNAGNRQAVYDFFDTMASKEAQIRFAREKGSMPARKVPSPLDRAQFNALVALSLDDIEDPNGLGVAGYVLTAKVGYPLVNLANAARDFFQTGNVPALQTFLKDNYSYLK